MKATSNQPNQINEQTNERAQDHIHFHSIPIPSVDVLWKTNHKETLSNLVYCPVSLFAKTQAVEQTHTKQTL